MLVVYASPPQARTAMADRIIDRLVSSLAAGLMGTDEFIDAVESQVGAITPAAGTPQHDGS